MKKRINGVLKAHLIWPLLLLPFLIAMTIQISATNIKAGQQAAIYVVFYGIFSLLLFHFNRSAVMSNVVNYALDYNLVQKHLLTNLDIPYANLDLKGNVLWANDKFLKIAGCKSATARSITTLFPDVTLDMLPCQITPDISDEDTRTELSFVFDDRYYRMVMQQITIHDYDFANDEANITLFENSDRFISIYLYDETELNQYLNQIEDQDIVIGLLYIDNYAETLESCDETERSLLMALVEREIAKSLKELDGIYRKMENDRYFFIFQNKYLERVQESKFDILDSVRNVTVGDENTHVTISIGIGLHAGSYAKRYEYARTAIDLALGRGGNQAVVKDGEDIFYYGGKSVQKESYTRVRARVKANALNELILAADQIFIMGHANADIDSFGASVGIYRIARSLEHKSQIVIDPDDCPSIAPALARFMGSDYYNGFMIDCSQALSKITPDTLLIIVDTNRAGLTQCPELISKTRNIVVIDHHRQTGERIENQVLSYIEPFSSSASEMVTEFFKYISDGIKPRPIEADTLYSGIMVDTNNFASQTNVRTFEAVAYLKRAGADLVRVRKMFRSNPSEYMIRAQAIGNAEIFLKCYAIARLPLVSSITNYPVVGAKVANSLLDMDNIKASFVLSEFKGKTYINARSIDEANVQLLMEKLGGGGHVSAAACQLDIDIDKATTILKATIERMIREDEL